MSVSVCVHSGEEGVQTGNKMDKTAAMLLVTHVDKNKKKMHEKSRRRGRTSKTGSTFRKLGAERTQRGISKGGGERKMFHGAVMPIERGLNVFNIT